MSTLIVVPCYNEEKRLKQEEFLSFARQNQDIIFLFVDDGSKDNTWHVLESLKTKSNNIIHILKQPQNAGKAEAVRQGILNAVDNYQCDYVGFLDADLAIPLYTIRSLITILNEKPNLLLAMGSRVKLLGRTIERKMIRHYLGRCFATCASITLNLPVYDTQCGIKLFRVTGHLRDLFAEPFLSRWIFDVEILARLARMRGGRKNNDLKDILYEHPLEDWRDVDGTKLKKGDFFKAVSELFFIWKKYL